MVTAAAAGIQVSERRMQLVVCQLRGILRQTDRRLTLLLLLLLMQMDDVKPVTS